MLLIDTGAEASIIKNSVIKNPFKINVNEKRDFSGAFGGCTRTIGQLTLQLNDMHDCIFNVVNNLNNTHLDGILGTDFLKKRAVIDLIKNQLIINTSKTNQIAALSSIKKEISTQNSLNSQQKQKRKNKKKTKKSKNNKIKMIQENSSTVKTEINQIMQIDISNNFKCKQKRNINNSADTINIPAQCSKIIEISTPIKGTFMCDRNEIEPGVFVANSISATDSHNNRVRSVIINTKEVQRTIKIRRLRRQFKKIDTADVKFKTLNQQIYSLSNSQKNQFKIDTTDVKQGKLFLSNSDTTDVKQEKIFLSNLDTTDVDSEKVKTKNSLSNVQLREAKILSTIGTNDFGTREKEFVENLVHNYSDVFFLEGDNLGYTNIIEHGIDLEPGKGPIHAQPYKIPHSYKPEVKRQIDEMLEQKIIRPSISPYNAPIVVVKKKGLDSNGNPKLRICLDFRRLNDVTISDAYPLPNINEFLMDLQGANYISIIDLAKGFHQIRMKEEDAHKTAFSFDYGHYEFIRMPFGLKNSPATFQRGLDRALVDTQGLNAFCYIDDAIIISEDLENHQIKLEEVLNKFRKHNLKLQTEKCKFLKKEVTYVGHQISKNGIAPDPTRYESVRNFALPKTTKQVRQFLGLCNQYRKFIENYAMVTGPLNDLLKGEEKVTRSGKKIE